MAGEYSGYYTYELDSAKPPAQGHPRDAGRGRH